MTIDIFIAIMGILAICLISFIGGWQCGAKEERTNALRRFVGDLRIDTSNEDGPYMFLELSKPVDFVMNQEYITLYVNTENYISRQ